MLRSAKTAACNGATSAAQPRGMDRACRVATLVAPSMAARRIRVATVDSTAPATEGRTTSVAAASTNLTGTFVS